jgi:hypothetical protein
MNQLHAEAERTAQAAPEAVWSLVSDVTRYPEWGPWSAAGYRRRGEDSPGGPGAVQWFGPSVVTSCATRSRWSRSSKRRKTGA